MDWYNAKKNIIYLLLVVNALLVFSILNHNNNASIDNPYFSKKSLEDFREILDNRGIILSADLPRDTYTVGSINVEYEDINRESYPELFTDFENIQSAENSKRFLLEIPREELNSYFDMNQVETFDEQVTFAQEFLEKYFPEKEFDQKHNELSDHLSFNPIYNGVIFEESHVDFQFGENSLLINGISIIARDESPNKMVTITSVEGVLNALQHLDSGDEIVNLDFIYYFDLADDELYRVKNARAFPVWRIITQTQKVIYISAFSG